MDLNTEYLKFKEGLKVPVTKENLDFLGINLSEGSDEAVFKVYYATRTAPSYRQHPFVRFLYERDMLRDFEPVKDTISDEYVRIDIALKNRTDENMEQLMAYLQKETLLFAKCKEELLRLGSMKITDLPGYRYSSIYHLGATQKNGITDSLKWYFFTRWCEDPNVPGKNSEFRDEEYLRFLKSAGGNYSVLAEYAKKILKKCGGHLWMAGLDVKKNGWRKNKIYIKGGRLDFRYLAEITDRISAEQLKELQSFCELHPELEYVGIAVCMDSNGRFIMNYYCGF